MTLQEFSHWVALKVFRSKAGAVYLTLSPLDVNGKGVLRTRNSKGQENSCSYFLEEEYGALFISYMDKEYLIRLLPESKGFDLFREGTVDQKFYIVDVPKEFLGN